MKHEPGRDFLGPVPQEEPRWLAAIALLAVGGLYMALPEEISLGPRWLLLAVVAVLLVPTMMAHHKRMTNLNRALGLTIASIITVSMIGSVVLMVALLPQLAAHHIAAGRLLRAALVLWVTNVLVFALWYWHLDAGGPHRRELRLGHADGAFLFPQMTMTEEAKAETGELHWSPGFVDYLFLAFNTSTALSPADTAVLSGWAKVLMMIQATISLTIVALLAARAVNIL